MQSEHTKKEFDALEKGVVTRDQVTEQFGEPDRIGAAAEGGVIAIYKVQGGDYYLRYQDDFRSSLAEKVFEAAPESGVVKAGGMLVTGALRGLIIMVICLGIIVAFILIAKASTN